MDESDLNKLILDDLHGWRGFIGVFSRTRIPISDKIPASYIINLDEYGSGGTHWIAVYISDIHVYIFDSFGGNYLYDGMFLSFINSYYTKGRTIISSPSILQHYTSATCGMYCVLFIFFI